MRSSHAYCHAHVLLAILGGCLMACGGLIRFSISEDIPEQEIPGSALPSLVGNLFRIPIQIDVESEAEARGTGPVRRIELREMRLVIQEPESADWSFVDRVDVYVESREEESDLERVKVATVEAPGAERVMEFDPEPDLNLRDYVNEGPRMIASAEGSQPDQDVRFDGELVFRVSAL